MIRPSRLFAPALVLVLAACLSTGGGDPFAAEGASSIEVEILNLNWNDATVWAHRLGQRTRVGTVTGTQSETFSVRWPFSAPLRLEIRLVGGDRCITEEIPANPGDRIYMEIPQRLSRDPDCRLR